MKIDFTKLCLEVGGYTITYKMNDIWITNSEGEKIQTTDEKFGKLIADFYYDES